MPPENPVGGTKRLRTTPAKFTNKTPLPGADSHRLPHRESKEGIDSHPERLDDSHPLRSHDMGTRNAIGRGTRQHPKIYVVKSVGQHPHPDLARARHWLRALFKDNPSDPFFPGQDNSFQGISSIVRFFPL
jgi:hypothetical protein